MTEPLNDNEERVQPEVAPDAELPPWLLPLEVAQRIGNEYRVRLGLVQAIAKAVGTARAEQLPELIAPDAVWAILYDDYDVRPEILTTEVVARERFRQISGSWNAHLFVKVASNSRDNPWAKSNAKVAAAGSAAAVDAPSDYKPDEGGFLYCACDCGPLKASDYCPRCPHRPKLIGTAIWNAAIEAAALVVQPTPHVDEERTCGEVAAAIRRLKHAAPAAPEAARDEAADDYYQRNPAMTPGYRGRT